MIGNDGANSMRILSAERMAPHDLDAEKSVIGAAWWDNRALPEVAAILPNPEQFFRAAHQVIWRAVLDLYHAGQRVDFITVNDRLSKEGGIERVCDHDYLMEIRDCVCHAADVVRHARIVAESAARRDAIEAFQQGIRESYAGQDDAALIVARAVDRLKGVDDRANPEGTLRAGELVPEVLRRIADRRDGELPGVPTGFAKLDGMLGGSIQPDDYVLVAARPSMGKTSLAMNIAECAAVNLKFPTLVLSLEMGNCPVIERMVAARAGVNLKSLRSGAELDRDEAEAVDLAAAEIAAAPLFLSRRPSRLVSEACNEIRRYRARHKVELVILDYVQLLSSESPRDSEVAALTKISAALKGVTRDLGVPVVALSQLNRGNEQRGKEERRPKLSDLRGSGALEQDADVVIFLHRPDYYDPNEQPGIAEVIVAKNRNGETGEFTLWFDKHLTRFRNLDDRPPTIGAANAPF